MSNEYFKVGMQRATQEMIARLAGNMKTATFIVERQAKINCPIDMGLLRSSMFSEVFLEPGKVIGRIGNSCEYAPYVHQGTGIYAENGDGRKTPWGYMVKKGKYAGFHFTHGQKPQPFLDKAKTQKKDNILAILGGVENA